MKILKAEREARAKGRSRNEHISLRMKRAWRAKHEEVAEGMEGLVNHEVSLLEVLFKEPTSSVCSDSGWGWALELTHLGLHPLVLTLSRLGCFGFFNWKFEITVGPHAILKNNTEIPCTLCPVSPSGDILQNFNNQDIDIDTWASYFYFFKSVSSSGIVWLHRIIVRKKRIEVLSTCHYYCHILLHLMASYEVSKQMPGHLLGIQM